MSKSSLPSPAKPYLPSLLFFLSGFAALAYEVLWFRQLRLLLGSGGASAALVVGVFFGGLGAGARLGTWASSRPVLRLPVFSLQPGSRD